MKEIHGNKSNPVFEVKLRGQRDEWTWSQYPIGTVGAAIPMLHTYKTIDRYFESYMHTIPGKTVEDTLCNTHQRRS